MQYAHRRTFALLKSLKLQYKRLFYVLCLYFLFLHNCSLYKASDGCHPYLVYSSHMPPFPESVFYFSGNCSILVVTYCPIALGLEFVLWFLLIWFSAGSNWWGRTSWWPWWWASLILGCKLLSFWNKNWWDEMVYVIPCSIKQLFDGLFDFPFFCSMPFQFNIVLVQQFVLMALLFIRLWILSSFCKSIIKIIDGFMFWFLRTLFTWVRCND